MASPLPEGEPTSLIVLTGALGDVARGLPLAAALKAARPRGRVVWVAERRWAPVVGLCRHVDACIAFDRQAGVAGVWRLARALRAGRYDVAFDLQRLLKSGAIAWWSRAPRRVGFHPREAKEANHIFNTEHLPALGEALSKVRHYLAFAAHVGAPVAEPLDFGLDRAALAAQAPAAVRTRGREVMAVVVGTSWPSKDWPAARWQRLCDLVAGGSTCDVVLVGTAGGDNVGWRPPEGRVIDLRGRTSVVELVTVLACARAAAGPDTGPGHLAAAVGTPYVGVYGPTDPRRVSPWGADHLAVRSAVDCSGCPKRRCRRGADSCMAAVTAEQVWERLAPLLAADRPGATPG